LGGRRHDNQPDDTQCNGENINISMQNLTVL
jgi:hypothetical protein